MPLRRHGNVQTPLGALGEHGTERALPYLRQVASEPATTDDGGAT